jgi:tetratricopeptide (TPR) repeat protein
MLVDDGMLQPGDGAWTVAGDLSGISVPPTIGGLLTARLDRLSVEERAVIECASVVGREFWWGAVSALSAEAARPRVILHLQSLTRKELIRPDYADRGHEAAFRFTHILIQEAAYRGIPKGERAGLHERLAEWIETEVRDLAGEYEEIVGHHLERAARLRLELAPVSEQAGELGRRAAGVLASAGRRAFDRGDMPAAVKLYARAVSLLPERGRERAELLPQLAFALLEIGDFERLQAVVDETIETAAACGAPDLAAYARIVGLWMRLSWNPDGWAEAAQPQAEEAIVAFTEAGDERGLAKAWALLGLVHIERAQFAAAEQAWERAAGHAHRAGDRRDELEGLSWIPLAVWAGPTPAEAGLRRCREVVARADGDRKVRASALIAEALLVAGQGRFDEARERIADARALLGEVALTTWLAGPLAQFAGWTELLAGNPVAAARELRAGYDALHEIGERSWLSTLTAILAEALYAQGRDDEAEELVRESEASAGAQDAYSRALSSCVRAKLAARRGDARQAERLADEAVSRADTTDFAHLRCHVRLSEHEVLRLGGGDGDAGRRRLEEAIGIAEAKGSTVVAAQARERLGA